MSLPMAGGPPGGGPGVPTHPTVPMENLIKLAQALMAASGGEPFSLELAQKVADDNDAPLSHVFAGAGIMGIRPEQTGDIAFVVCVGGCQGFGALDCIDDLIKLRKDRAGADKRLFDVHPVSCMDRCQLAPAVRVHTPDGVGFLPSAKADALTVAVAEVCDG